VLGWAGPVGGPFTVRATSFLELPVGRMDAVGACGKLRFPGKDLVGAHLGRPKFPGIVTSRGKRQIGGAGGSTRRSGATAGPRPAGVLLGRCSAGEVHQTIFGPQQC